MKRIIISATLMLVFALGVMAQSTKERLQLIEDKMALKELVDSFSILADQKDVDTQVLLFTEDAEVNTYYDGKLVGTYKGRESIGKAFASYLSNFSHVFHMNGQQIVEIDGDHATGVSYCQVYLKGTLRGKNVEITDGAYYNDEYVKRNGRWLIDKRTTNFVWQNTKELCAKEPMQSDGIVRLSHVEVYPEYIGEYLEYAKQVGETSLRTEPGVLTMYAMQEKDNPNVVTILETYASQEAYHKHIASPHFQHYKQGTLKMVKNLKLVDQNAVNERNVVNNYIKE